MSETELLMCFKGKGDFPKKQGGIVMNTKQIQKMTAVLLAASMLTACKADEPEHEPTGATLDVSFDHAYASEPISAADGLNMSELYPIGDYLFIQGYKDDDICNVLYDPSDGSEHDIFGYADAATKEHGIQVAGVTEHNGNYEVLYQSFDVEDEYTYFNYSYYMETYDKDLKLVEGMDVTEHFPEEFHFTAWNGDGQGYYYGVADGMLYCFDETLTLLGQFKGAVSGASHVITDMNGSPYAVCYSGDASAVKLDPETLKAERLKMEGLPQWAGDYFGGNAQYHLYCKNDEGIFGLDLSKGVVEKIADWSNSGFTSGNVWRTVSLPDDRFLVSEMTNHMPNDLTNHILRARTQEEMENMQLITLALINGGDTLKNLVHRYNRQSEGHYIVIHDYQKLCGEENFAQSTEAFYSDLLEGRIPDMIETQTLDMEVLGNKGMFEDLRPWIESDPDFNDEQYLMNFFDALEYRGELTSIAFSYRVCGAMAKTKYIGDRTDLRMEDYLALAETMPEDMRLTIADSPENTLYQLCDLNAFVDTEKGKCYFDSKEFVQLLEVCGSMKGMGTMIQDDNAYRNDAVMFYTYSMSYPYEYHILTEGYFGGEDARLVGKPVAGGSGNGGSFNVNDKISVNRESLYKEEIWDFIKFCLSEEQQRKTLEEYLNFPVNRTVLNEWMEAAMTIPEADPNHHHYADDRTWNANGVDIPIGAATQEEMDTLLAFIEGIESSNNYNSTILNILSEEAQMYFAGDQPAEQAAKNIQSRVSLYLSEQE